MWLYCSYVRWLARGLYLEKPVMSSPGLLAMFVQLPAHPRASSTGQKSPRQLVRTAAAWRPPASLLPATCGLTLGLRHCQGNPS